jgi:hypothetical protein
MKAYHLLSVFFSPGLPDNIKLDNATQAIKEMRARKASELDRNLKIPPWELEYEYTIESNKGVVTRKNQQEPPKVA